MMKPVLSLFLAAVFLWPAANALSQISPSRTMPPVTAIFAQGSVAKMDPNLDPARYSSLTYGGTAGIYFQSRPWLGLDARILILQSRSQAGHEEHQRAAFAGPRFALHRGRFRLYGVLLGGVSHADYVASPIVRYPDGQDVLISATKPALQAGGGVDLRLVRRLYWRIGEATYNHMFVPDGPNGMSISTGLVLKIFR